MSLLIFASSATKAIAEVFFTAATGYFALRYRILTPASQKGLSSLNLYFLTPCLLFTQLARSFSPSLVAELWPIPFFFATFSLLAFVLAKIGKRVLRVDTRLERFMTAGLMFSNSNNLPLSLVASITSGSGVAALFMDEHDTAAKVFARGMSYAMIYALFNNIVRWSYGMTLFRKTEAFDELVVSDHTASVAQEPLPNTPLLSSPPVSRSTSSASIVKSFHDAHSWTKGFVRAVVSIMNPPMYAILAALIVGSFPALEEYLFNKHSLVYPVTRTARQLGKAAIPMMLVALGSQLAIVSQSSGDAYHQPQTTASRRSKRSIRYMIACKTLLFPLVAVASVMLLRHWLPLGGDPMFLLMVMVLGASPPAVNLIMLSDATENFEEETSTLLLQAYLVAAPSLAVLVTLFLYIVHVAV